MKIGIVGAGRVGSACALAAVVRGSARNIVIVDRTRKRAKAVATDLSYGSPLCPKTSVVDGDFADLADAALVMVTAGINEKAGGAPDRNDPRGRLRLLDTNAEIYRDIVPRIVRAAPRAVILVVTDPPDPLADAARTSAGHDRVLSTGTFLDSLRFRVHLAGHFDVDANPGGGAGNRGTWRVAGLSLVGRPYCRRADRQAHRGARRIARRGSQENRR